jgi:hypothetical protein
VAIDRTPYNALVDDDGSNTVGTLWTKAKVASVLLDPIDAAIATVGISCRATNASGTLSVASATVVPVTFATEAFDMAAVGWSAHDLAVNPSRLTAPFTGKYLVVGGIAWSAQAINSGTFVLCRLARNGVFIPGARAYYPIISSFATNGMSQAVSAVIDLASTQYVTIEAYHDAAGAYTLDLVNCALSLVYLGA